MVTGKVAVSDDVIEQCRTAVMRLHQIDYVLGQLMLPIGSAPGVLDAVMDILKRIGNDTSKARTNLEIILRWQAAGRIEVEAQ